MRISDWSSDVCSSDLLLHLRHPAVAMQGDVAAGLARGRRPLGQRAAERLHGQIVGQQRSEEHTSELQSLMRISYAVFCLKKKTTKLISHVKITVHKIHQHK